MTHPDRTPPIYGPIEGTINRVRRLIGADYNQYHPNYPYKLTPEEQDLHLFGAIFSMHLGVESSADPKILPALGVIRKFTERSETGEKIPFKEFIYALKPHFTRHQIYWKDQRDTLMRLYQVDRDFIDRALDFEAEKQQTT